MKPRRACTERSRSIDFHNWGEGGPGWRCYFSNPSPQTPLPNLNFDIHIIQGGNNTWNV